MLTRVLADLCYKVDTCRECPAERMSIKQLLEHPAGTELWARCDHCQRTIDVLRLCLEKPKEWKTEVPRIQPATATGARRTRVM